MNTTTMPSDQPVLCQIRLINGKSYQCILNMGMAEKLNAAPAGATLSFTSYPEAKVIVIRPEAFDRACIEFHLPNEFKDELKKEWAELGFHL